MTDFESADPIPSEQITAPEEPSDPWGLTDASIFEPDDLAAPWSPSVSAPGVRPAATERDRDAGVPPPHVDPPVRRSHDTIMAETILDAILSEPSLGAIQAEPALGEAVIAASVLAEAILDAILSEPRFSDRVEPARAAAEAVRPAQTEPVALLPESVISHPDPVEPHAWASNDADPQLLLDPTPPPVAPMGFRHLHTGMDTHRPRPALPYTAPPVVDPPLSDAGPVGDTQPPTTETPRPLTESRLPAEPSEPAPANVRPAAEAAAETFRPVGPPPRPPAAAPAVPAPPVPGRAARSVAVGAKPGQLTATQLDHHAVDLADRPIAKLEPEFGYSERMRSLAVLVLMTLLVAAAMATVAAIGVEAISVWANHAISKSAGT